MEHLHFTTRVLGKKATDRLKRGQVTQTLRSWGIAKTILSREVELGYMIDITLDGNKIGLVQLKDVSPITLDSLSIDDARRGGFDSISELAFALKRAGYRFKPIEQYQFYRIQFMWL